jgi:transcriptional regulator GlxA family with amidase domain
MKDPQVMEENEFIATLVAEAAEAGFRLALERYAKQLKAVPELAAWHRKREAGRTKGHESQSRAREELAARIRTTWASMEAAGDNPTNDTVAAACGCSRRTVQRAFKQKP